MTTRRFVDVEDPYAARPRALAEVEAPSEIEVQQRILLAVGALEGFRAWRQNTGTAWQPITPEARLAFAELRKAHPSGFRPVTYGVNGAPDVMGIAAVHAATASTFGKPLTVGRFVGLEVKAERGRQSKAQRAFQAMVEGLGGLYRLVRNEDEARAAVDDARAGRA